MSFQIILPLHNLLRVFLDHSIIKYYTMSLSRSFYNYIIYHMSFQIILLLNNMQRDFPIYSTISKYMILPLPGYV